jgi:catechol 2,3-dioxygenase-like lactoylglutathione lyase family enzyme
MGLSSYKIAPAVAVSDLEKAKGFYEGKLGLSGEARPQEGAIQYQCAEDSSLYVYMSPQTAGKGAHTLAAWTVPDVEQVVDELTANGVEFEHYDSPMKTDAKGIFDMDGNKVAWFKDPDGNIFGINSGS